MPRKKTIRKEGSELLTRVQAAEYLGVAEQTLAIWKSTGRYCLPVVKVGRLAKYRRGDLDEFLNRRTLDARLDTVKERGRLKKTPASLEHLQFESALDAPGDFAEVRLVERQQRKADSGQKEAATTSLEIVLPDGVTLRLGAGCSMDLLASVVRILEKQ